MFLKDISFRTANIIGGWRVAFSRQVRPVLPLASSEKSKGDLGKVGSSFAQIYFVIKVYIPVLSYLSGSHINQTQTVRDVLQNSCSAKS